MKARLTIAGLLAAAALLALPPAHAGTVYLMNGEEIDGDILDVSVDSVTIRVGGGRVSYPLREVRDVEIRPGASIYERKLKDALDRAKAQKEAERAAKAAQARADAERAAKAAAGGHKPPPTLQVGPTHLQITPAVTQPHMDVARSGTPYDSDRYRFSLYHPSSLKQAEPEAAFLTFKDERGVVPWSFNVTYFETDETDWDSARGRAQSQLELLSPHYKPVRRSTFGIGRFTVERTTGFYERASHAIRHDQLVAPTGRGVLVIHFFSPGAGLDDHAVPDVEAVIKSIELK